MYWGTEISSTVTDQPNQVVNQWYSTNCNDFMPTPKVKISPVAF